MGKAWKWGILAPGKMSAKFTRGIQLLPNATLHAVASRDLQRAKRFAEEFGFRSYYGSYRELASDPDVEIIYIASPHSAHYDHTDLCLRNNKHVICEKAFSMNYREVYEMTELARNKGLFLMEALWPPFQPFYKKAGEIIASGILGPVYSMYGWFSFQPPYDPNDRKFNISLGGGSLLDIGIYPVIDCLTFMGVPDEIKAVASFAPTGSEDSLYTLFRYNDGRLASVYSSFRTNTGIGCTLYCEKGNLTVSRGRDMNQKVLLELHGKRPEEFIFQPEAMGYHLEAEEVMRCLDKGLTESPVVPHSFSLGLMKILDRIREAAGIHFPGRD